MSQSCDGSDSPHPFPFQDHQLLTASVDNLTAAIEEAPPLREEPPCIVKRISENAVVKANEFTCLSEARNMQFVANNTSVRVPKVIRSFEVPISEEAKITYIIMEYVPGEVLRDCWNDMSEERRENVCDQVLEAITELHSLKVERPGPIGGGKSRGTWFSDYEAGPFHSVRELEDWFTRMLDYCKRMKRAHQDGPAFTGMFGNIMVMSHMDIAPRNIILEENDRICLIDWEFAGAYPVHFERAGLQYQVRDLDFRDRILMRMKPYEQEIKNLIRVRYGIVVGPPLHLMYTGAS